MPEQKLLLDQPPTVTHQGQVEFVQHTDEKDEKKVQINDATLEGVQLLLD